MQCLTDQSTKLILYIFSKTQHILPLFQFQFAKPNHTFLKQLHFLNSFMCCSQLQWGSPLTQPHARRISQYSHMQINCYFTPLCFLNDILLHVDTVTLQRKKIKSYSSYLFIKKLSSFIDKDLT